ncbi:MAG: replicative DNA helicase [Bacillales bacterium]|nr:replicative DNA helicase [Bacillales bacterium]
MEKVMPHSLEAEQAVLCSMFLSKYALNNASENLVMEDFYFDKNAKIFKVMTDLHEKNVAIDVTTVTNELNTKEWLVQAGGVEYLSEIVTSLATAANVDEYINIVHEKALLRKLINESTNIITDAYNAKDEVNDLLDSAEKKILNVVKNRRSSEFKKIQEVLFKTQSDLEFLSKNKGDITGLATNFSDYDRLTKGLHPNELIILAARPGVGKTAFALNLATNVAMNSNSTVAIFTLEMAAEQLAMRMISSIGKIEMNKLKSGNLAHEDLKRFNEAISRLAETKIYIDDTAGITIGEIRSKCRRLASSPDGLSLVIIDYLTLIQGSSRYSGNRQQEVSEISRSLKTMALELGVPVIALAQLSRNVEGRENKRPILSDLRESGSIEQDADIVAFLYRDDYYADDKSNPTSDIELIIAKHRSGPPGTINLKFQKNFSNFVNVVLENE